MNNLTSYCGLFNAKIRASDKDLLELTLRKNFCSFMYASAHLVDGARQNYYYSTQLPVYQA